MAKCWSKIMKFQSNLKKNTFFYYFERRVKVLKKVVKGCLAIFSDNPSDKSRYC